MTMEWLLATTKGRASRSQFLAGLAIVLITAALASLAFRLPFGDFCRLDISTVAGAIYFGTLAFIGTLLTVNLYCLATKRLHDTSLPDWPVILLVLLPWIIFVVFLPALGNACARPVMVQWSVLTIAGVLIVLALALLTAIPGRRGENRYGPDPLGDTTPPAAPPRPDAGESESRDQSAD